MMIGNETLLRLSFFNKGRSSPIFCRACLVAQEQIRHRSDISAAVGTGETIPVERSPSDRPRLSTLPSNRPLGLKYKTKAAVLLSRPPLLTQDLTSFERSFYLYQRRLNERLALPFTRYFYYARGTPGDVEWKRKIKERLTPAREIGQYSGYGEEAWNDEILIGNDLSEPGIQREALLRDAEVEVKGRGEAGEEILKRESLEKPAERITDADRSGDMRSLNRKLERTLYLVVRGKQENDWYLPGHELMKSESLHTAAERIIVQTGGIDMNTWVVGNMPIGHQIYNYAQAMTDKNNNAVTRGEKVFVMKARIMAGKVNLKNNNFDLSDHRWLTKEELKQHLSSRDWCAVKNILIGR